jgi:hypothetical protein
MVPIQYLHTSPLKYKCSSPSINLMSCSLLSPWLYSFNYLSCGNVICGIFYFCSLDYLFYGNVIYSIVIICLTSYTISGTTLITVGNVDGYILPLIIFCALKYVLSCSLFIPKLKVPPSSTMFFLLRALLGESIVAFFLFSSAIYISSLVFLTLANGFYGLSF